MLAPFQSRPKRATKNRSRVDHRLLMTLGGYSQELTANFVVLALFLWRVNEFVRTLQSPRSLTLGKPHGKKNSSPPEEIGKPEPVDLSMTRITRCLSGEYVLI